MGSESGGFLMEQTEERGVQVNGRPNDGPQLAAAFAVSRQTPLPHMDIKGWKDLAGGIKASL